nr:ribbon-helix-helix protein, CopG family [Salarchaeum sp. JOR-1]
MPVRSGGLTVSLGEDARDALDTLTSETDRSRGELVRRALTFYAANYEAASTDRSTSTSATAFSTT